MSMKSNTRHMTQLVTMTTNTLPSLPCSLRRPNTRISMRSLRASTPQMELVTKQKSLPDVSGISVFAYSMGRVGFIKPPDMTGSLMLLWALAILL